MRHKESTPEQQIEWLKTQKTGDIFHDAMIQDEIDRINAENGKKRDKPQNPDVECIGCGS